MPQSKRSGEAMAIRSYKNMTPVIGDRVFIDEAAVVLGNVAIGEHSSVWPGAVIRGDMHKIRIGKRTSVQDGAVLHITHAGPYNPEGWPLIIGDDVTIGHNATLHGCTIHDRVLIGIGAIVLDGAVIESEVLVAAGTMVPPGTHLESGYLYKGSPARKGRPLTDKEREFFIYSSKNYVRLKESHLKEGYAE